VELKSFFVISRKAELCFSPFILAVPYAHLEFTDILKFVLLARKCWSQLKMSSWEDVWVKQHPFFSGDM